MMRRIKKKMIQQQQRLLKSLRFMANNNNQNTNILDRPNHLNDDDDDDYGDHDDFVIPHISLPLYIYCKQYMSSNHEKRIRLVDSPSPSFGIFESSSTSATVAGMYLCCVEYYIIIMLIFAIFSNYKSHTHNRQQRFTCLFVFFCV